MYGRQYTSTLLLIGIILFITSILPSHISLPFCPALLPPCFLLSYSISYESFRLDAWWPTILFDQQIARIHRACIINLFIYFWCNIYHFRYVLCNRASSLHNCIRGYSYGKVQIDRCRNVRPRKRESLPFIHFFIYFFSFFFLLFPSFSSYNFIKSDQGRRNDTTLDCEDGNFLSYNLDGKGTSFDFETPRIDIRDSRRKSNVPHCNIQFYFSKMKKKKDDSKKKKWNHPLIEHLLLHRGKRIKYT